MMHFLSIALFFTARQRGAEGFAPSAFVGRPATTARSLGIDPAHLSELVNQHLNGAFSTFNLADAAGVLSDAAATATSAAVDAVSNIQVPPLPTPDAALDAAATDNGWFGFLTSPIEGLLQLIHTGVAGVGAANAWGLSIIALTILIKVVTFPLTKTQLESTTKMQAMQPAIKEIQTKYQSNPEVMNQKIAEFYQTNEINPLAGCLPSLVQIPVFIGLYRAVLDLAKTNQLNEPFLFLPNLEGPTYGADPASGADWILKGWADGVPSMGWSDTIAFLILPIFLVISQFVSMELMQPKSSDPTQQQTNLVLKILPFMIGWFALNVPAALSVYWVTNNIITTASSLWVRSTFKVEPPKTVTGGGASTATMESPASSVFAPVREKPAGFGSPVPVSSDGVKPITPIDAEIVEEEEAEEYAPEESGTFGTAVENKPSGSIKKKRKMKRKKST